MSTTRSEPARASRALRVVLFAAFAAGLAILALPQLWYPYGHDQGIYSACGLSIARGGVVIQDCFEPKQPGVMVLYAIPLSFTLHPMGLHAFTLAWQAVTAIVVGLAVRSMFGRAAALPAGAVYWLMYAGINYWSTSQAETYANVFICGSIWLVWLAVREPGMPERRRLAWLAAAGALGGVTIWFKYIDALIGTAMGLVILADAWRRTRSLRTALGRGAAFGAAYWSVSLIVVALFALGGGLDDLWAQALFLRENYPLNPPLPWDEAIRFLLRFFDNGGDLTADYKATVPQWTVWGGGFPALFVLAGIGLARHIRDPLRHALLGLVFVAGVGVVTWQWKFVQYHFSVLHVPLAIGAAAGVAAGLDWLRSAKATARAAGIGAVVLGCAAVGLLALRMAPWAADAFINVVVQGKSPRDMWYESRVSEQVRLADEVLRLTGPDEAISLFTDAPWVYTLTDRRNATRFPMADTWSPRIGNSTYDLFSAQYLAGLERNRPKLFVLSQDNYPWINQNHVTNWKNMQGVHAYVEANYAYVGESGPFLLFVRRP